MQTGDTPKNSQELPKKSVYTSPAKEIKPKVGQKRSYEEATPGSNDHEPPAKRASCDKR